MDTRHPRVARRSAFAGAAILGLVGIVALGASALFGRPSTATSSPTVTTHPTASRPPATQRPTPQASQPVGRQPSKPVVFGPDLWSWEKHEFEIGVGMEPLGIWPAYGHFIVVGRRDTDEEWPGWVVMKSEYGIEWESYLLPPEFRDFYTGQLVDGQLWFVARIHGSYKDTWRLIMNADIGQWVWLRPSNNMGAEDGARFVTRVGNRWLVSAFRMTPDEPFPIREEDIRYSRRGTNWSVADVPHSGGDAVYARAEQFGRSVVVMGTRGSGEDETRFFMTSRDGLDWAASDVPWSVVDGAISDYICTDDYCVAVGSATDDNDNEHPMAWRSTDGLRWREVEVEMPPNRFDATMDEVLITPSGFLAQGGPGGDAWLSEDGRSWRHLQVMPPGESNLFSVALAGDRIVGLQTDGPARDRLTLWTGSLAAMEAAP